MTDLTISVRGEHSIDVPAELGVAHVSVRIDGPERTQVLAQASALGQQVAQELREAEAAGSLKSFFTNRVSVWSDRPWNDKGKQLPLVHHATLTSRAEFTDFTALSAWVTQVSEREGMTVERISWELTKETAKETEKAVAQGAVQVAVDRATAYASALGLGNVRAIELADQGLMTAPQHEAMFAVARSMKADSVGGSSIPLEPTPITVSATVEARFVAS